MEELGNNGIKIYTFPSEQPVSELNTKMNVSDCVRCEGAPFVHCLGVLWQNYLRH